MPPSPQTVMASYLASARAARLKAPDDVANSENPNPYATTSTGQQWSFKVDNIDTISRVRVRHTVTVSTGVTPGTPTARTRNPIDQLGVITVSVNGGQEVNAPADMLLLLAQYMRGREALELDSLTTAEVQAGSTTPNASVDLPIDFAFDNFNPPAPAGSIPTSRGIERITIQGDQLGGVSTLMNSPGATQALSAVAAKAFVRRLTLGNAPPWGFGAYWRRYGSKPVSQTGNDSIKLEGGARYAGILFRCIAGSTADPSDSVLTTGSLMTAKLGGKIVRETYPEIMAKDFEQRVPSTFPRTGGYYWNFLGSSFDVGKAVTAPPGKELEIFYGATTSTGAIIQYLPVVVADVYQVSAQRKINLNRWGANGARVM